MDAEGGETPSTVHGGSAVVTVGMVSTGRRLKKPTHEETEVVDNGTIMTDSSMVKRVSSGLGELILGYHGLSIILLLSVWKIHLVWKNGSSTVRNVDRSSTQRDGGRKGRTNLENKVRIKRDLAQKV